MKTTTNSGITTIQIQNSEDFAKLDLTKFSPKQIFGYNCTSCGKYYERSLSKLQQTNFELLCRGCNWKKHRKPRTEEQKKATKEKRKQTCLEKYGVEHASQSEKVKEKIKHTNLERYGVDNPRKSEKVKEKIKQTNLERYGVEYTSQSEEIQEKRKQTFLEKYGVESSLQSEKIREKCKQTNLERYGTENPSQSEEIQEKRKQTFLEKYGVDNPRKSEKVKEKIKQTNLERYGVEYYIQSEKCEQTNLKKYGVEHPWQSPEIREKIKQTNLAKYGAENYFQSKESQSKRKQAYRYDGTSFDSKPELAFYVYCKDHGMKIKRNDQRFFIYEFERKNCRYFPDFEICGTFYEIKGSHFLKEDGTWQNPFDHSQDPGYEAKHQCAIQNKVEILYKEDYQRCIDYVLEKYGEKFFEFHHIEKQEKQR